MPTPIRSSGVAIDMGNSSQRKKDASSTAGTGGTGVARKSVSRLREIFGQAILVISGQRRMMYQNLVPKPEGTIFSKRSPPQGTVRTPHDATTIMTGG
jgi:hypothetical protein